MRRDRCVDCAEYKRCRDSAVSVIFFAIGLVAIIAVRVVTILEHVNPIYGKLAWYVGVFGFILYFAYKFSVDHNRSRLIAKSGLKAKVSGDGSIGREEREIISSILCALSSGKDRINYLVIFVSSAIVLVIAFYMDFLSGKL